MKRSVLNFFFVIIGLASFAQNGLEQVIVERFYVSDVNDEKKSNGELPAGSVTYRVYLDLLPGYRFQAAYGIPGHELKINSTENFYNSSFGGLVPNAIPMRNVLKGTTYLDSYVSAGACIEGSFGVLKSDDKGAEKMFFGTDVLQNTNASAGLNVREYDGMIAGDPARVTVFGIEKELEAFNKLTIGKGFTSTNGSWASLYGAVGADSLQSNKVLIGQFTTKGDFSFELNVQIGSGTGAVENYVARNPVGREILIPSLIFNSAEKKSIDNKKKKKNI